MCRTRQQTNASRDFEVSVGGTAPAVLLYAGHVCVVCKCDVYGALYVACVFDVRPARRILATDRPPARSGGYREPENTLFWKKRSLNSLTTGYNVRSGVQGFRGPVKQCLKRRRLETIINTLCALFHATSLRRVNYLCVHIMMMIKVTAVVVVVRTFLRHEVIA